MKEKNKGKKAKDKVESHPHAVVKKANEVHHRAAVQSGKNFVNKRVVKAISQGPVERSLMEEVGS